MLIDELLPNFDVSDRYHTVIEATRDDVWQALWTTDLCDSQVVSWLFWLRGLPSEHLSLSDIDDLKFKIIGEERNSEVVFGVIGQFWNPDGNLLDFDPAGFKVFEESGYAKCAWNFSLESLDDRIRLTTETRIQCIDETSRGYFDLYWAFVRPFSGWTRKEILAEIKSESEGRGK